MSILRRSLASVAVAALLAAPVREATAYPYASEITQILNNLELMWSNVQQAQSLINEFKMLVNSGFSLDGNILQILRSIQSRLTQYEGLVWQAENVLDQYNVVYPDNWPEISTRSVIMNRELQVILQRNASLTSKSVTGEVVENADAVNDQIASTSDASDSAEGQTSAVQVGTQASLINAELLQKMLLMQAAHYRAVETDIDNRIAAQARAEALSKHLWRDVKPRFGGVAAE